MTEIAGGGYDPRGRGVVPREGRADVDQLGVSGALEHEIRRLDIAMYDPVAVQGRQRRQAVAQDGDGDPRFEPGLSLCIALCMREPGPAIFVV